MMHTLTAISLLLLMHQYVASSAISTENFKNKILILNHDDNPQDTFVKRKSYCRKFHDMLRQPYSKNIASFLPRGGAAAIIELDSISTTKIDPFNCTSSSTKRKIEPCSRRKLEPCHVPDHRDAIFHTPRGGQISQLLQLIHKVFNIKASELIQFLSMSTLMFFYIYIFTTVRDTKDTLVVSNCGAEAIPFLKLYGVTPIAMLFLVVYSKMAGILSREMLFYVTLVPFFVFYFLFAYVLFPFRDSIHFAASSGVSSSGSLIMTATSLIRYWSFSLYFIVSDLWASAGIPLLFWQCANDVTSLDQAKRFYPLFAVIGNLAPIISGKVMSRLVAQQTSSDDTGFGQTLQKLAVIKVAICMGIILLYNKVYTIAGRNMTEDSPRKAPKPKTSLRDSFNELANSPSLRSIATMVFCYNMCIDLSEVLWKGLLRKMYQNKSAYMSFMAQFSQRVGIVTLIMQLLAPRIISILGWKGTSLLTPLIMGTLAVPFFLVVIILRRQTDCEVNSVSGKGLTMTAALAIGTWKVILSKVTKYSLFDPCKEMAYIPLDPELKVKGKAAVDVMGARFGHSMSSLIQQILVLLVGGGSGSSIINCVPYVGVVYVATTGFWLRAVLILGKFFESNEDDDSGKKTIGERKIV